MALEEITIGGRKISVVTTRLSPANTDESGIYHMLVHRRKQIVTVHSDPTIQSYAFDPNMGSVFRQTSSVEGLNGYVATHHNPTELLESWRARFSESLSFIEYNLFSPFIQSGDTPFARAVGAFKFVYDTSKSDYTIVGIDLVTGDALAEVTSDAFPGTQKLEELRGILNEQISGIPA